MTFYFVMCALAEIALFGIVMSIFSIFLVCALTLFFYVLDGLKEKRKERKNEKA